MTDFLMKPKIDFAFKEIMTDEKARIGFLSAMLKLDPKDIKETILINTHLRKTYEDDKLVQRFLNPHILSACYFCQRKAEEGGNAVALLTDGAVCQWHRFSTDRNGV
ncbi:hypothetical protein D7V96_08375 [bacterium D16-59]|nr:hypothetical protein D7V96_08375 [bacterium D16-59]